MRNGEREGLRVMTVGDDGYHHDDDKDDDDDAA